MLRERPQGPGEEGKISLLPGAAQVDGKRELRWSELEGADAYKIYLFSVELEELVVLGPVTEPSLVPNPDKVPNLPDSGTSPLWRGRAFNEGDLIASSSLGTFIAP